MSLSIADLPIVEFDDSREAFIEPSMTTTPRDVAGCCVPCFFLDVVEKVAAEHDARIVFENRWEDGVHRLYELDHNGKRVAFFQPGIGAPIAVGLLEEVIGVGCSTFVACGGCGVLNPDVGLGHLLCVESAVRDEGVSYHYLPPSREVVADRSVLASITSTLEQRDVPHTVGKTWTTSAPYRETRDRIARRREEGCVVVEMEAAAMMAVAQFRGARFGQILYGGDDLSGSEWDNRDWQRKEQIRENLFWLCVEAVLAL